MIISGSVNSFIDSQTYYSNNLFDNEKLAAVLALNRCIYFERLVPFDVTDIKPLGWVLLSCRPNVFSTRDISLIFCVVFVILVYKLVHTHFYICLVVRSSSGLQGPQAGNLNYTWYRFTFQHRTQVPGTQLRETCGNPPEVWLEPILLFTPMAKKN